MALLGQLVQADHLGLIGVEQALVGPGQALDTGAQFVLGCCPAGRLLIGRQGEILELGEQALRIAKQAAHMFPDRPVERLAVHLGARARRLASRQRAVFAATPIAAPPPARGIEGADDAIHGQAAAAASQQAAQQMIVPRVVAEREGRIAFQLGLSPLPEILVDQRRHRNGDPLLARPQLPAAFARIVWVAAAWFLAARYS